MKRFRVSLSAICLSLALCAVLSSCSSADKFKISKEGGYVNTKTNVTYKFAPGCYEPIVISEEVYGKLNDVELYKMGHSDPQKWLSDVSGCIFYAEGVELPALDKLKISKTQILLEESTVEQERSMTVNETETVDAIIEAYMNGERVYKPSWTASMYDINWRIRFADEELGVYYTLAYFELEEDYVTEQGVNYGKRFLYNRYEDKENVIPVSDILASYVEEYRSLYVAN